MAKETQAMFKAETFDSMELPTNFTEALMEDDEEEKEEEEEAVKKVFVLSGLPTEEAGNFVEFLTAHNVESSNTKEFEPRGTHVIGNYTFSSECIDN